MFLVENLDANHEDMKHLKAICFLRPTRDNIRTLRAELKNPKFGEYYICACEAAACTATDPPARPGAPRIATDFSNIVHQELLQQLAEGDERELIKGVKVRNGSP